MPNRNSELPTLAVLMPAYNVTDIIKLTLSSLQANTFPFDLFIVDDGSQLPLSEILGELPQNIHVFRLDHNVGITAALNYGLAEILQRGYTYIARMDVGDTTDTQRFAKQIEYLENNPEVGVVGCWVRVVHEKTRAPLFHLNPPTTDIDIRLALHFNNCVTHPAMMFRASVLQQIGEYSSDYPNCEDYEIIFRIAAKAQIANIPEYLMDCEMGMRGLSLTKRHTQLFSRLRLQLAYMHPLQWRGWLGIAKTLILFVTPNNFVQNIRSRLKRYKPESSDTA
jgi:GT2 family glycosyltransferase